jgi:hypothetical protein
MGLFDQAIHKKENILRKWFDAVVDTYPADTARFLKSQQDPFANPVGSNTRQGLDGLLDELFGSMDPASIDRFLDPIIRIRSIQDFTPSHATSFPFFLKRILRESLAGEATDEAERIELDARIDRLVLMAFDLYLACREKVYEIKENEMRKRLHGYEKRINRGE